MRNARAALVWLPALSFLFMATALRTSAQATSTPEERAQWVETTHKLENAPLDEGVNKQGDAALKRLSEVHDIHVSYLSNRDAQSAHFDWAFPFGSAGGFAQHSADFVEIGVDKMMGKTSDPPYDEVGP